MSYGGRLIVNEQIALTDDPVIVVATAVSDCSLVRLTPVVGVTTGAHYRMSTGHSSPALSHELRGGPGLDRAKAL